MLGYFNKLNIIQFTNEITEKKDFDAVHKFLLYGINDNMSVLVHNGKYGAINTAESTTIVKYVVKFLLGPYTLQDSSF